MKNTIWMDITTLMGWNRPPVGIVRTEFECANYILTLNKAEDFDYKFCKFEPSQNCYVEIPNKVLANKIEKLRNIHLTEVFVEKTVEHKITDYTFNNIPDMIFESAKKFKPVRKVRGFFRKNKENFPALFLNFKNSIKIINDITQTSPKLNKLTPVTSLLIAINKSFEPITQSNSTTTIENKSAKISNDLACSPCYFKKRDTILCMGLDWEQKSLKHLYSLKKEYDLNNLMFCYDIIPVKFPQLCVGDVAAQFARYFTDVAWISDTILCISKCSEKDLLKLLSELNAPIPKTDIVKLGCNINTPKPYFTDDNIQKLIQEPYILFVSTIERRKNHEVIYKAMGRLCDLGFEEILPNIVFVGMQGWGVSDLMKDIELDPRLKDKFILLNHVDDNDLAHLYSNCLFTVFPSLYEGWGLPVAESLAFGKLPIVSNTSSLPEVGEKFALYCDPLNTVEWAETILELLSHPTKISEYEIKIRNDYQPHSWHSTSKFILDSAKKIYLEKQVSKS